MSVELPFRKNVSIILINQDNHLLLGERFSQKGIWQFPQGGVEDQDSLEETVYREIEEELGLPRKAVKIIKQLQATNKYSWEVVPAHFAGKFQGQDQTFWLVELCDSTAKFNLLQEHQEFQQVQWVKIEDVLQIVEPARVPGYSSAIDEIKKYLDQQ
jgi:putative (di)nucleoside polyphosphate hydrolase